MVIWERILERTVPALKRLSVMRLKRRRKGATRSVPALKRSGVQAFQCLTIEPEGVKYYKKENNVDVSLVGYIGKEAEAYRERDRRRYRRE